MIIGVRYMKVLKFVQVIVSNIENLAVMTVLYFNGRREF